MIDSLPRKIAVSHAVVIAISLLLAGIWFVRIVREYQEDLITNRLVNNGHLTLWFIEALEQVPPSVRDMRASLGLVPAEFRSRVVFTDLTGQVLFDSGDPSSREI